MSTGLHMPARFVCLDTPAVADGTKQITGEVKTKVSRRRSATPMSSRLLSKPRNDQLCLGAVPRLFKKAFGIGSGIVSVVPFFSWPSAACSAAGGVGISDDDEDTADRRASILSSMRLCAARTSW